MQETQVWSLGQENVPEKEMATYSRNLACEISWTEEPGRLQSMGSQESNKAEQLNNNKNMFQTPHYYTEHFLSLLISDMPHGVTLLYSYKNAPMFHVISFCGI